MNARDDEILVIPVRKWIRLEELVSSLRSRIARLSRENKDLHARLAGVEQELERVQTLQIDSDSNREEIEHYIVHRDRIRSKIDDLLSRLEVLELPTDMAGFSAENHR
jgi:chromosome segregation ATPase